MLTASLRPATLAEVLMLRLVNAAARSSSMMASTVGAENWEEAKRRNPAGAASAFIVRQTLKMPRGGVNTGVATC